VKGAQVKRRQIADSYAFFLITILVALLHTSCFFFKAPPHNRMYSGASLPREQVALLANRTNDSNLVVSLMVELALSLRGTYLLNPPDINDSLTVKSVDRQKVRSALWEGSVEIELLPGQHSIVVGYYESMTTSTGIRFVYSEHDLLVVFKAEAGHTYLACAITGVAVHWRPVVFDITDKENPSVVPTIVSTAEKHENDGKNNP